MQRTLILALTTIGLIVGSNLGGANAASRYRHHSGRNRDADGWYYGYPRATSGRPACGAFPILTKRSIDASPADPQSLCNLGCSNPFGTQTLDPGRLGSCGR